jgi:hypothetical protein
VLQPRTADEDDATPGLHPDRWPEYVEVLGLRSGMLALQPDAVGWTALAMAEAKAAIAGRSPHYLVCVQASGHEVARSFA